MDHVENKAKRTRRNRRMEYIDKIISSITSRKTEFKKKTTRNR